MEHDHLSEEPDETRLFREMEKALQAYKPLTDLARISKLGEDEPLDVPNRNLDFPLTLSLRGD